MAVGCGLVDQDIVHGVGAECGQNYSEAQMVKDGTVPAPRPRHS